MGGAGRGRSGSGSTRASRSSASTTRTPRRSRSGSGRWRRSATSIPRLIFLAEAFTRPRVMERLAKVGFNQSYTYFAWRQSAWELREYFTDLATRTVDYFRPNAWPNTPDILTEQLQHGGRAMFVSRAILAATLSANWGIYGPAFELLEHRAVRARLGGVPRLGEVPGAHVATSTIPSRSRP